MDWILHLSIGVLLYHWFVPFLFFVVFQMVFQYYEIFIKNTYLIRTYGQKLWPYFKPIEHPILSKPADLGWIVIGGLLSWQYQ